MLTFIRIITLNTDKGGKEGGWKEGGEEEERGREAGGRRRVGNMETYILIQISPSLLERCM